MKRVAEFWIMGARVEFWISGSVAVLIGAAVSAARLSAWMESLA